MFQVHYLWVGIVSKLVNLTSKIKPVLFSKFFTYKKCHECRKLTKKIWYLLKTALVGKEVYSQAVEYCQSAGGEFLLPYAVHLSAKKLWCGAVQLNINWPWLQMFWKLFRTQLSMLFGKELNLYKRHMLQSLCLTQKSDAKK